MGAVVRRVVGSFNHGQVWEEANDDEILKGKRLGEVGFGFERNFWDKSMGIVVNSTAWDPWRMVVPLSKKEYQR